MISCFLSWGRYSLKPPIVINNSAGYEGFRRGEDCGNIDPVTIGMQVTTADGRIMTIASVTETSRTYATYNLTVADFQTYFVGNNRVLVHNCGEVDKSIVPIVGSHLRFKTKWHWMRQKGVRGESDPQNLVWKNICWIANQNAPYEKKSKIHYKRNTETEETGDYKIKQSSKDKPTKDEKRPRQAKQPRY